MFSRVRFVSMALALSSFIASATAADLLWDFAPGTPGAQDGSGDWNTANSNWLISPTQNTTWSNSPLHNAVFGSGGFAGTVAVTEPITVGDLSFNQVSLGKYLIAGAALNLTGTATITTIDDAEISAPLTGVDGMTKRGPGTLTLSGVSSYSGPTNLQSGTVKLLGGANRLPVNTVLRFGANTILQMNDVNQTAAGLVVNDQTATVAGNQVLTIAGASDLRVGSTQSERTATLDLSGLAVFVFNNSAGTFAVGAQAPVQGAAGVLKLAATNNTVTAAAVHVGNSPMGSVSVKGAAQLELGMTNEIIAADLIIGGEKNSGSMAFRAGLNNPSLILRGLAPSGRIDLSIGISDAIDGDLGGDGLLDVRAGLLDASVANLRLGRNNNGARSASGKLLMSAGTLDATSIVLGSRLNTSTGAGSPVGQLDVNGGTVSARLITFADKEDADLAGTVSGFLNLLSGTLKAERILAGAGTDGTRRVIRWTAGEITHFDANSDLNISGVDFVAEGNATHRLIAQAGRTISIDAAVTGNISKEGSGALILGGTSNNSGANFIVNAGTIVLAKDGQSAAADSITMNSGGTLQIAGSAVNQVGTLILNGVLVDLNGRAQILSNLTADAGTVITNHGATLATVGIANLGTTLPPVDLVFFGSIRDGSGPVAVNIFGEVATNLGTFTNTVVLRGDNSYSGNTTIVSGILSIDADSRLGRAPATPTPDHLDIYGTLRATESFTLHPNRGVRLLSNGFYGSFDIDPGVVLTIPGTVSGSIVKKGSGALILTDPRNTGANHQVDEGILRFAGGSLFGGTVNIRGFEGQLELAGDYTVPATLTIRGRGAADDPALVIEGHSVITNPVILDVTHYTVPNGGSHGPPFFDVFEGQGNHNIRVESGSTLEINAGLVLAHSVTSGEGTIRFEGAGTGILAGPVPYAVRIHGGGTWIIKTALAQQTIVADGTLIVESGGRVEKVLLDGSATLDLSALGEANVSELSGSGTVKGDVIVFQLAPGLHFPQTGRGTLLFSNSLVMGYGGGTETRVAVSKNGTVLSADLVEVGGVLTLGGTLKVARVGDDLAAGDQFNLFDASAFIGNFETFSLPALSPGLRWDTSRVPLDGTLSVIAVTNEAPVAQPDSVVVAAETVTDIDVLANDADPNGDSLTIASAQNGAHGTTRIVFAQSGQRIQYNPASGFIGDDSFTYTVADGFGGSAIGSVSVRVNEVGVNRPPIAQQDQAVVAYSRAIEIDVLANDSDPDGDSLAIASVQNAASGTTTIVHSGRQKIRYNPTFGFVGNDTFTYSIADPLGGSAVGTVNVTVTVPDVRSVPLYAAGAEVRLGGDPSSGVPAGARWASFGIPSISDEGQVAFTASMDTPQGRIGVVYMGLASEESDGSREYVVVRKGDVASDSDNAVFAAFKEPLLNNHGTIVFLARLNGNGRPPRAGIWKHYDNQRLGAPTLVAIEGAQPPGAPVGARWKAFSSVALADGPPGSELIAFTAKMMTGANDTSGPGGVTSKNDLGLWIANGEGVQLALRENQSVLTPSGPRTVTNFVALKPVRGAPGQGFGAVPRGVLAQIKFSDRTRAVLRLLPEGGYQIVALQNDALEGSSEPMIRFDVPAQSSSGEAAFTANLAGKSNANAVVVERGPADVLTQLVRNGDKPLPNDTATLQEFSAVTMDSAGRVAFLAKLKSASAARSDDTAIFTVDESGPKLIAREGSAPPGVAAGARWEKFPSVALPDAPCGPIFSGRLLVPLPGQPNPANITFRNRTGVWAVDSTGVVRLIVRTGDALVPTKQIKAFTLLSWVDGSPSQSRFFNTEGEIIYRATLSDGSQTIVKATLP
jgi:autotransporter-associated beta strand protein